MNPSIYNILDMNACDAAESLSVMIEKESKTYSVCNYLDRCQDSEDNLVTAYDRVKLVDWCYTVIDHCEFQRETVTIAMEITDRFLSIQTSKSGPNRSYFLTKKNYQLVAMAALYTAIKTNEQKIVDSNLFSSMCQGIYTAQAIEDMEMEILNGLSWRVCAPTSLQTANLLLSLVFHEVDLSERTWEYILDDVRFQAETAVRDYYFTPERSSTIAVASILNTFEQIENEIDRSCLYNALLNTLSKFNVASVTVLFAAKKRLSSQIDQSNDSNENEMNVSTPRSSLTAESMKYSAALAESPRTVALGI